jgi:hypothetical protein
MGVEYCHYLVPRPNSFYPTSQQLAVLVESLASDNWIAAPGSEPLRKMATIDGMSYEDADEAWAHLQLRPGFASVPRSLTPAWFQERLGGDLKLGFPVEHADQIGLQYPLINDTGPPEDPYYEIQLHLSREYVQHVSELIEPSNCVCVCGESLEFDPDGYADIFYASRVWVRCPRCSTAFDPSSIAVVVRDGWTGEKTLVKGGTIYRFAIVVDCGKCIPKRVSAPIRANPSIVALCQRVVGQEFYEVGDIY